MLKLKADANSECWLDCVDAQAGQYINMFCHFYNDTRCRYSYEGPYNIMDSVVHAWIQRSSKSTLTTLIFIFIILFFWVDEGGGEIDGGSNYHQNGPSSVRQRNAISMAFSWPTNDDPTLNADFEAL